MHILHIWFASGKGIYIMKSRNVHFIALILGVLTASCIGEDLPEREDGSPYVKKRPEIMQSVSGDAFSGSVTGSVPLHMSEGRSDAAIRRLDHYHNRHSIIEPICP